MTDPPPARLEVEVRRKLYPPVGRTVRGAVLGNVAFSCEPGSFTALLGSSGVGKTTLLNLVAGLDRGFEGKILIPPGARLGYVFQEPRLLPWRTVEENVRLAMAGTGEPLDPAWLDELLTAAGLATARDVYPTRLSLGMARRAALVRAFAVRPSLLLMDEPFVSLDEPTAERLRELLLRLLDRRPATVLFVTHNLREAVRLATRLLMLDGAPARLVADVPVTLDATARRDPMTLAAAIRAFEDRLPQAANETALSLSA